MNKKKMPSKMDSTPRGSLSSDIEAPQAQDVVQEIPVLQAATKGAPKFVDGAGEVNRLFTTDGSDVVEAANVLDTPFVPPYAAKSLSKRKKGGPAPEYAQMNVQSLSSFGLSRKQGAPVVRELPGEID